MSRSRRGGGDLLLLSNVRYARLSPESVAKRTVVIESLVGEDHGQSLYHGLFRPLYHDLRLCDRLRGSLHALRVHVQIAQDGQDGQDDQSVLPVETSQSCRSVLGHHVGVARRRLWRADALSAMLCNIVIRLSHLFLLQLQLLRLQQLSWDAHWTVLCADHEVP